MMRPTRRAFTIVELLVVLAVSVILAGVLFPVFRQARAAGQRTVCASNFHQVHLATMLYVSDYDDRFMPVNHQPAELPNSRTDRTWVQLVLPYVRSFSVFRCPSDDGVRPRPDSTFDQDLVPGDTYSQYYRASLRSNLGYNYLYLAPVAKVGERWVSMPRSMSSIGNPSRTLMFVDSVFARDGNGRPVGGGQWLVTPPCRYLGTERVDSIGFGSSLFTLADGWEADDPASGMLYGGAWPWHTGRITIARVDGSVGAVSARQLAAGCDV
jgi:prepilin-type N-terminal cleavage/methylation domain-containing protein